MYNWDSRVGSSKPDIVNSVQVIMGRVAIGVRAYQMHRQMTYIHIMALTEPRPRGSLTPREKEMMIETLRRLGQLGGTLLQ